MVVEIVLNLKGRPNGTLTRMMMKKKEGRNFVRLLLIFLLFLALIQLKNLQVKQQQNPKHNQQNRVATSTSLSSSSSFHILHFIIIIILIFLATFKTITNNKLITVYHLSTILMEEQTMRRNFPFFQSVQFVLLSRSQLLLCNQYYKYQKKYVPCKIFYMWS